MSEQESYIELSLQNGQVSVRMVGLLSAAHRGSYADALELVKADSPLGLGHGGAWLFPAGRLPRFLERLRAAGVIFKLGNLEVPTQATLQELTTGCRISQRPDPADSRFMLTEVRLPYDIGADHAARVVTGAETIPTWFEVCITALKGGGVLRGEEADELRRRLFPMEGPSEDTRAQVGAQLAARRGVEGPLSEEARAAAENHLAAALSVMAAGVERLHTSEPLALLVLDQEVSQIASPIFGIEGDDPSCGLPVWGVFIPANLTESVALDLGLNAAPVEGEGDTLLLYDVLGLRGRRRITLAPPAGTVH